MSAELPKSYSDYSVKAPPQGGRAYSTHVACERGVIGCVCVSVSLNVKDCLAFGRRRIRGAPKKTASILNV